MMDSNMKPIVAWPAADEDSHEELDGAVSGSFVRYAVRRGDGEMIFVAAKSEAEAVAEASERGFISADGLPAFIKLAKLTVTTHPDGSATLGLKESLRLVARRGNARAS